MGPRLSLILVLLTVGLTGCGDGPTSTTQSGPTLYAAQLGWTANREKAVNSDGGGYRVYYAKSAHFSDGDAKSLDVPFSAGSTPTKATVTGLEAGQYYFRIVAFSALKGPGGANSISTASPEVTLTVP